MRIALVFTRHRYSGGVEKYLNNIARYLAERGDEVFIVGGFAMARPGMPITPMPADGPPPGMMPGMPGSGGQGKPAQPSEKQQPNEALPAGGE